MIERLWSSNGGTPKGRRNDLKRLVIFVVFIVLAIFLLAGFSSGVKTVPAGHRGVVMIWGAVSNTTLNEGLNFVTPFASTVVNMSIQTQAYDATAEAASRDLQNVVTTMSVNYRLVPDKVNKIYQTLGEDYVRRVIAPKVQHVVKTITSSYAAEELITRRQNVSDDIKRLMAETLSPYWIEVDSINLTNFEFDADFMKAIEDKVVATQRAQQAENKLREIEAIARQVEAEARGAANAAIVKAEGDAKAMAILASAEAAANNTVAASITPLILQYRLIEKLAGDARVIIVPATSSFIIGSDVIGK